MSINRCTHTILISEGFLRRVLAAGRTALFTNAKTKIEFVIDLPMDKKEGILKALNTPVVNTPTIGGKK